MLILTVVLSLVDEGPAGGGAEEGDIPGDPASTNRTDQEHRREAVQRPCRPGRSRTSGH